MNPSDVSSPSSPAPAGHSSLDTLEAAIAALPRDGWCPLESLGVVRAEGPEATAFLQGQLTQDVAAIAADAGMARSAALLTPKGRMLASFWMWPHDAQAQVWWLVCSRDLAAALAKRLSMFVLRAKVRIADVSTTTSVIGSIGTVRTTAPEATLGHAALPEAPVAGSAVRARRTLWLVTRTAVDPDAGADLNAGLNAGSVAGARVDAPPFEPALRRPERDWLQLEILTAQARVTLATQDAFVPQMVNFDVTGGVSFTKGCYPGQEVVARTHYLGRQKRRMALVAGHGDVPAALTDVFAVDGPDRQPLGRVISAVSMAPAAGYVALIEAVLPEPSPDTLQIGDAEAGAGEAKLLTLPYPIPEPAPNRPK